MTIRTHHGTAVRIIRKLPPFRCSGQEIENIDERSVTRGNITDVNLYELTEGWPGEIAERMKEV